MIHPDLNKTEHMAFKQFHTSPAEAAEMIRVTLTICAYLL